MPDAAPAAAEESETQSAGPPTPFFIPPTPPIGHQPLTRVLCLFFAHAPHIWCPNNTQVRAFVARVEMSQRGVAAKVTLKPLYRERAHHRGDQ